jgi:hypothetical protein
MNLARTLLIASVVVLAMVAALQHRTVAQLRDEHLALEKQIAQTTIAAAANPSAAADTSSTAALTDEERAEVLRSRGELARSRSHTTELAAAQTENRAARFDLERFNTKKASATADYWPREAWKFAGFASPDAALQSSLLTLKRVDNQWKVARFSP